MVRQTEKNLIGKWEVTHRDDRDTRGEAYALRTFNSDNTWKNYLEILRGPKLICVSTGTYQVKDDNKLYGTFTTTTCPDLYPFPTPFEVPPCDMEYLSVNKLKLTCDNLVGEGRGSNTLEKLQ